MSDESPFRSGLLRVKEFLRWLWRREVAAERVEPHCSSALPSGQEGLRNHAQCPQMTWLGGATLLLQVGDRRILVDPVVSRVPWWRLPARRARSRIPSETLNHIDAIVATGGAGSRMDPRLLETISRRTLVVVPTGLGMAFCRRGFNQVVELEAGEQFTNGNLELTALPVRQSPGRRFRLRRGMPPTTWPGLVILADGASNARGPATEPESLWLMKADVGNLAEFRESAELLPRPDAVVIPVSGKRPNWLIRGQRSSPEQALHTFQATGGRVLIPLPAGSAQDGTAGEIVARVEACWKRHALDPKTLLLPRLGEAIDIPGRSYPAPSER